MKKILSSLMAFVLLCGVVLSTVLPVRAMPAGREMQTIEAMNGLLNGITGDMLGLGDVANWSDEQINRVLSNKMMWDSYGGNPWLPTMGIPTEASGDGYIHVERSAVEELTQDIFGRTFVPAELPYMLEISGGEVLFGMAAGEHTQAVVQDFIQRGDYYVAVGCIAWFGGPGSEVEGYFQAVFRKNDESMYGMTLISLEKITGNQSFAGVTAEASSVLSGGDYKAANVLDGRDSTAWVEGTSGTGMGEFVELMAADGAKLDLCGLEIDPGYHKSGDILTKNGWPSKILVETDDGVSQEFYCYSTDTQTILFDIPAEARCVRITILEAESGSKYTDTCISEIRLKGIDTDRYFENLVLDLPEETLAADALAPEETQPAEDRPETGDAPAEPVQPETEADKEERDTWEEEEEDSYEDDERTTADGLGDLEILQFLQEKALLIILVGAGSLILCAGIAVLILILRKKK